LATPHFYWRTSSVDARLVEYDASDFPISLRTRQFAEFKVRRYPRMNAWRATIEPGAHRRWMLAACTLSVLSMVGMIIAVPDVDRHPVVFAFSLSWVIGGFVGIFTQSYLLRMDPWRFGFARWEREGRVYRCVGVEAFRWCLRHTAFAWLNPASKMTARKSDLENLLRQMNFAEGAHLVGGVITLGLSVGYMVTGHVGVGLSFGVITILVHFYPLILQRWNRGRVARIAQRIAPGPFGKAYPCTAAPEREVVDDSDFSARTTDKTK
jgi:hypothetical protein